MNYRIRQSMFERLTAKESIIVGYVVQGLRNREIASRLGTTEQVIKNHLGEIYQKVGVSGRLKLTLAKACCKTRYFDSSQQPPEKFGLGAHFPAAIRAAVVTIAAGSPRVRPKVPVSTRGTTRFKPGWTERIQILDKQEHIGGKEKFLRTGTTANRGST